MYKKRSISIYNKIFLHTKQFMKKKACTILEVAMRIEQLRESDSRESEIILHILGPLIIMLRTQIMSSRID